MRPSFKNVHLRFRLNGLYFNREDLKEVAYSLVKEGVPYEQAIGDFLMDWLNEKDELEVQTSGTTGTPKIIKLKKHHMVNSAIATGDFFGISVGDKALHCLPSNFIAGKMMLIRALILGLEIDTVMPSSTPLKGLPYKEYDFSAMIPLQVKNSLNELARIKTLIIGGAAVSEPLMKDLQKLPVKAYETYGMTETITHVAAKSLNASSKTDTFKGLPGVNFASDDRNCLLIDAKEVSDNKIQTNDIVEIVSKSEFKWLGRYDTIINSGGIKLIPEQIELKLQHLPAKITTAHHTWAKHHL